MNIVMIPMMTVGIEKTKIVRQYMAPVIIFMIPTNLVHFTSFSSVSNPKESR
jgi:hypothetical protein